MQVEVHAKWSVAPHQDVNVILVTRWELAHPDLHRLSHGPDRRSGQRCLHLRSSPREALDRALTATGEKDVDVFSASIGQLSAAGLVDEIRIHLVPLLLGAGTRLIDDLGHRHIRLHRLSGVEGAAVSHLRYAVVKEN